jgi:hypothetical protein
MYDTFHKLSHVHCHRQLAEIFVRESRVHSIGFYSYYVALHRKEEQKDWIQNYAGAMYKILHPPNILY